MTIKERIIKFIKRKDITQKFFCDKLGVLHNYITTINKSIPSDRLVQIIELYPDLNIDWLLTGQGEMLREVKQNDNAQPALSVDVLAYLREKDSELRAKDDEIRELRARIDELTRELHERELEIVELKKREPPCGEACRCCGIIAKGWLRVRIKE